MYLQHCRGLDEIALSEYQGGGARNEEVCPKPKNIKEKHRTTSLSCKFGQNSVARLVAEKSDVTTPRDSFIRGEARSEV